MATQIWAHRGASAYAPENSMEAFALAAKMGADGIELDVHLSQDGELIVAHDETVDRCSSGTGRMVDMTLSQLKELDFSAHKPGYRATRIPTLEEVYAYVKTTGMVINVEIKSGIILYDGIEKKLVELTHAMGMQDRVTYSSFNHYSLMQLKAIDPAAPTAPLYSSALFEPWHYAKHLHAQAIHPYYAVLKAPGLVEACRAEGILINPWTVDAQAELAWLMNLGVHAVITNVPDIAVKVRSGQ